MKMKTTKKTKMKKATEKTKKKTKKATKKKTKQTTKTMKKTIKMKKKKKKKQQLHVFPMQPGTAHPLLPPVVTNIVANVQQKTRDQQEASVGHRAHIAVRWVDGSEDFAIIPCGSPWRLISRN